MFFVPFFLIIIALGQLAEKDKEFVHYIFSFSFIGQGLWEMQIIPTAPGLSLNSTGL